MHKGCWKGWGKCIPPSSWMCRCQTPRSTLWTLRFSKAVNSTPPDNSQPSFSRKSLVLFFTFDTTGQLSTKLFQKKLSAFLYIHPRSVQPSHIFPAFIRERLLAIRKFCSEEEDFVWAKANFKERLLKRGYSEDMLKTVFGKETPSQDDILFPAALNSATSKDKSH